MLGFEIRKNAPPSFDGWRSAIPPDRRCRRSRRAAHNRARSLVPTALLARQQGWSRRETDGQRRGPGSGLSFRPRSSASRYGWLARRCGAIWRDGRPRGERSPWSRLAPGSRSRRTFAGPCAYHHHHGETATLIRILRRRIIAIGAGPALAVGAVLTWHIHLHRAGRAHRMGHGRRRRLPPSHERSHQGRRGTRPVLIVGSSPIVEDIPAFFVAGE